MTLREARELIAWTQEQLARESGVNLKTISDLERGKNQMPSYSKVVRIIAALRRGGLPGVTAEQLFPIPVKHHD